MIRIEVQRAPRRERPSRWRLLEEEPGGRRIASHWRTAPRARRAARQLLSSRSGGELGPVPCSRCDGTFAFRCLPSWDPRADGYTWDEVEYLCGDCAQEQGYCRGCGNYWARNEQFDFSRIRGYCPDCVDEIESSAADGEDPEEAWEPCPDCGAPHSYAFDCKEPQGAPNP